MDREKLKDLVRRLRQGDNTIIGRMLGEWAPSLFARLEGLDPNLRKTIRAEFDKINQAAADPDTNSEKAYADIIERIEGMLREAEATDATRSMWTLVQVGKAKLRVQIDKVCENQWRVWIVGDIRKSYEPIDELAKHLPGDRFPKLEDARASVEKAFKLGGFNHAGWTILDAASSLPFGKRMFWEKPRIKVPFPPPPKKLPGIQPLLGTPYAPPRKIPTMAPLPGNKVRVPVSGFPDEREDLVERKSTVTTPPEEASTPPQEEKKASRAVSWIGFGAIMVILIWISFFVRWLLGVLGVLDPLF